MVLFLMILTAGKYIINECSQLMSFNDKKHHLSSMCPVYEWQPIDFNNVSGHRAPHLLCRGLRLPGGHLKYREYVCVRAALHPGSRKFAYLWHPVISYFKIDLYKTL